MASAARHQDEYALQSQQRTAAGQQAGKFDDEIVPLTTVMRVTNKETEEISYHEVTLDKDEDNLACPRLVVQRLS